MTNFGISSNPYNLKFVTALFSVPDVQWLLFFTSCQCHFEPDNINHFQAEPCIFPFARWTKPSFCEKFGLHNSAFDKRAQRTVPRISSSSAQPLSDWIQVCCAGFLSRAFSRYPGIGWQNAVPYIYKEYCRVPVQIFIHNFFTSQHGSGDPFSIFTEPVSTFSNKFGSVSWIRAWFRS